MTSIGMTSHCMTSRYGVHFCIECVNKPVPQTCKVSIRYVSWFTRYLTTLIIFRMTLVDVTFVVAHINRWSTDPLFSALIEWVRKYKGNIMGILAITGILWGQIRCQAMSVFSINRRTKKKKLPLIFPTEFLTLNDGYIMIFAAYPTIKTVFDILFFN